MSQIKKTIHLTSQLKFPVITVQPDTPTQLEQLGTKAKFWYQFDDNHLTLYKEGRPGTGENWAEKVCCEIARLLALPHAEYELALFKRSYGVITPSFVPKGGTLILGNELLNTVHKQYQLSEKDKSGQHTLGRVIEVLGRPILGRDIGAPLGWHQPEQVTNATGVFAGYLLLDALVANQDRHHENWGLIATQEYGFVLAPTFDHASSLGRNETDEKRTARLNTKDEGYSVKKYVEKAQSGFVEDCTIIRAISTLNAFKECAKANSRAALYWLDRLYALKDSDFTDVLANVPDQLISQAARDFANAILTTNRDRLLKLEAERYL